VISNITILEQGIDGGAHGTMLADGLIRWNG
jgi:hypothetical protein